MAAMKRGTGHKPKQYPPHWKNSESIAAKPPAQEWREARNAAVGYNPVYEYGLGHNLTVLTGTCTREPKLAGHERHQFCWFRLCVQNQDHRRQALFIPVRSRGDLAVHCWENVAVGDQLCVVGRIWTGRMYRPVRGKGPSIWRQFVYLEAERVSSSYPVQLDRDPRYVRVRQDLWNRMCQLAPEGSEMQIPANRRQELLDKWKEAAGWYDGIETEVDQDEGDQDPTQEQDNDADDERSDGRQH